MTKIRLPKLIICAALIITALVVLQALSSSGRAKENDHPYVGMGDLRRIEWESSIQNTGTPESSRPYVGMGDLRRFEAQQEEQDSGEINSP